MATFFNQASLIRGNIVTNSNVTEGELLQVLSASKTALNSTYAQGEPIAYAVNIVNSGTVACIMLVVKVAKGLAFYSIAHIVVTDTQKCHISPTALAHILTPVSIDAVKVKAQGADTPLCGVAVSCQQNGMQTALCHMGDVGSQPIGASAI